MTTAPTGSGAAGQAFRSPRGPYSTLVAHDPWLRRVGELHGYPDPFAWAGATVRGGNRLAALALHITSQQISTAVAQALFRRLEDATGPRFDADSLARLGVERLHALGLSRAKSLSLADLADRISAGALDLDDLDGLDDGEVVTALTQVRGIGDWTAEMFLIHQLRRPDVLPAGDLGIRRAVHGAAPQVDASDVAGVRDFGRRWTPYRTYAAALLWTSLSDPPAPTAASSNAHHRKE